MRKNLVLALLFSGASLFSQDIFGSWVCLRYDLDQEINLLDIITIIRVDEDRAIVQHSFFLKKDRNYILDAKIENGKIFYVDPISGWNVILELTSEGRLLTWHPDFDDEFVQQFRRADIDFYNFLANIDDFVNTSESLQR